eukprot:g60181.t1
MPNKKRKSKKKAKASAHTSKGTESTTSHAPREKPADGKTDKTEQAREEAQNNAADMLWFDCPGCRPACKWTHFLAFPMTRHPAVNVQDVEKDPAAYERTLHEQVTDPLSYTKARPIVVLSRHQAEKLDQFLEAQVPVVVRDSPLVAASVNTWTLDKLNTLLGERPLDVYASKNNYFRYYKLPKEPQAGKVGEGGAGPSQLHSKAQAMYSFVAPTVLHRVSFKQFLHMVAEARAARDVLEAADAGHPRQPAHHNNRRLAEAAEKKGGEEEEKKGGEEEEEKKRGGGTDTGAALLAGSAAADWPALPCVSHRAPCIYLQESLTGHPELGAEFGSWDWKWLLTLVTRHHWGSPDQNNLFIGMRDATTPVHFDQQENMFCQVSGRKEVYLWPPGDYKCFYPFPVNHPCDRQAMVNPDRPDLHRFPNFRFCRPHHVVLQPGDTLYLPAVWWHHFRNLDDLAISISFWSKQAPSVDVTNLPLQLDPLLRATVLHNLEELVIKSFGPSVLHLTSANDSDHSEQLDKAEPDQPQGFANIAKPEDQPAGQTGQAEAGREALVLSAQARLNREARAFMVTSLGHFMPQREAQQWVRTICDGRYTNDTHLYVAP